MKLTDSTLSVPGVGNQLATKLAVLGVTTIDDLINLYPRRYEDYSKITPITKIRPGPVTIEAVIKQVEGRYARRGLHITQAVASDETGSVRLVWFNQPYRATSLKKNQRYFISGLFELSYQRLSIMNPSVELEQDFPAQTARILPIYRETKGLTSKQIRNVIRNVVTFIEAQDESLPDWIVKREKLLSRAQALKAIHFPESMKDLEEARRRLGFEEVFTLILAALLNKNEQTREKALPVPFKQSLAKDFVTHLPFSLTDDQRRIIWRIYQDLEKNTPMNRLVEGDVGSGKTVVATMAALMAIKEDFQVAFMAPTELLARQHAATVYELLKPLSMEHQIALLVGGLSTKQKTSAREHIKRGNAKFIIGTHALIQEKVSMKKLALIVIDEQHRFGVEQRKKIMAKAGHMPHVLSLTATPIPRSLALTVYGELDISILKDKPANRKPILTKIVSPNSTKQLYEQVTEELQAGRQMFVVCPVIKETESGDMQSAEAVYHQMAKKDFKQFKVGLLHGQLKADEKNKIMKAFIDKELDILVSTTVIEVGVDVPNATIMMIESAERFGLAQLHQLRGRVGRGEDQGYCYLMMTTSKAPPARLKALESSNDGFMLAELDLKIRGPGAIYGTMQHGILDLRIAQLTDTKLIASAREAANDFVAKNEKLRQYKELSIHVHRLQTLTNLN